MKKITGFAILLSLGFILSACSGSSESGTPRSDTAPTSSSVVSTSSSDSDLSTNSEVTINEAVLVDEAGIKIAAKKLETDNYFGPELKLLIENDSGQNLTFQCRNTSINGYMVETMMSVDVANGKKANDSVTFLLSDFLDSSIDKIADIELSFHVFSSDSWDEYLDTPSIQILTSAAEGYQYSYDDSGAIAYEGPEARIIVKGINTSDSVFGPELIVYLENLSDRNLTVQVRDVSINGFMVDSIFSCDVVSGKHAVDEITFMSSDLEENGITSIENVELSFHIFDMDSWDTITDTGSVIIEF